MKKNIWQKSRKLNEETFFPFHIFILKRFFRIYYVGINPILSIRVLIQKQKSSNSTDSRIEIKVMIEKKSTAV